MGWTSYPNYRKAEVINDIKTLYPADMQWSLAGNNLWGLFVIPNDTAKYKQGEKVILLYRLSSFGKNEYGYKELCESVHPYHYNCPLKFLKEAVVECQEWRDNVVKFHESNRNLRKQVANLMIDDIIQLKNSRIKEVKIVSVKPLLGAYGGVVYKIPKNMIA
jgi:hypothetical protein